MIKQRRKNKVNSGQVIHIRSEQHPGPSRAPLPLYASTLHHYIRIFLLPSFSHPLASTIPSCPDKSRKLADDHHPCMSNDPIPLRLSPSRVLPFPFSSFPPLLPPTESIHVPFDSNRSVCHLTLCPPRSRHQRVFLRIH